MSLRRVAAHVALVFVPLALLLGAAELAVRWTRAHESCPNRFSGHVVWACDPILQFKLNPELEVLGQRLSSDGFRTHELAPKADGVFRVLALGDSCTFGQIHRGDLSGAVRNPYPLALEKLLAERVGAGRFEVINAGVPGYNSYQGLVLLRGKLRDLAPDLITVRFGWNDLFLSDAPRGRNPYRESDSSFVVALEDLALRTALYPFLRRLGMEWGARRGRDPGALHRAFVSQTTWTPTIPLSDFAHNLRRIVEVGRERGAEVWLLTSPHDAEASESTRNFVAFHNRTDFDVLMREQARYNEVVRAVGRELGAPVIDMDAIYRASRELPLFGASDAVHPSQYGHQLEASALFRELAARGIIAPKSPRAAGNPPGT